MPGRLVSGVVASALVVGALTALTSAPLLAQGKSTQAHGHAAAPSSSPLPIAETGARGLGAVPLAWLDDANVMEPGAIAIDVSASRWQGSGVGETDVPVVNVAVGVSKRVQFAATVPRVTGSEAAGVVGGLGTTYFSLKYAGYENDRLGLKAAVAPTLEVLGTNVVPALGPAETRAQIGVPVSVEVDRSGRRFYASTGWFSRGIWFAGGGAAFTVRPRLGISGSLSRSWTSADPFSDLRRNRTEISVATSYALTRHVSIFGSAGHTVATSDANGAGTTVAAGASLYVSPRPSRR